MKLNYTRLTSEDACTKGIFILLENCSDYFELCENTVPTKDTLSEIINEVPEGYDKGDKLVLAVSEDDRLIGLIDILKNYPGENTWMIGLLIIDPDFRGKGLGELIHRDIIELAIKEKVSRLRIGVVEKNINALKFWKRRGYLPLKEVDVLLGKERKRVIVMALVIS